MSSKRVGSIVTYRMHLHLSIPIQIGSLIIDVFNPAWNKDYIGHVDCWPSFQTGIEHVFHELNRETLRQWKWKMYENITKSHERSCTFQQTAFDMFDSPRTFCSIPWFSETHLIRNVSRLPHDAGAPPCDVPVPPLFGRIRNDRGGARCREPLQLGVICIQNVSQGLVSMSQDVPMFHITQLTWGYHISNRYIFDYFWRWCERNPHPKCPQKRTLINPCIISGHIMLRNCQSVRTREDHDPTKKASHVKQW